MNTQPRLLFEDRPPVRSAGDDGQGETMKTLAASIICVVCAMAPAPCSSQAPRSAAQPPTAPQSSIPDASAYARLVDRLKASDRTVEFTELRMAFTHTPVYRGMMMGFYQPLWRTLNARDFEGAIKVAEKRAQAKLRGTNAHMVTARAHRELGHSEQAEFHQFVVDGLIRSIASKGDGTTAESAYQVIDISEEYALFRSMNVSVKSQSIVGPPASGRPIVDRVVVVDGRTNEERIIFFSVDNPATIRR
jgi:hypothetical protein